MIWDSGNNFGRNSWRRRNLKRNSWWNRIENRGRKTEEKPEDLGRKSFWDSSTWIPQVFPHGLLPLFILESFEAFHQSFLPGFLQKFFSWIPSRADMPSLHNSCRILCEIPPEEFLLKFLQKFWDLFRKSFRDFFKKMLREFSKKKSSEISSGIPFGIYPRISPGFRTGNTFWDSIRKSFLDSTKNSIQDFTRNAVQYYI